MAGMHSLLVEEAAEGRFGERVVLDDPVAMPSWTGRSTRGTEAGCEVKDAPKGKKEEAEEVMIRPLPDGGMKLRVDLVEVGGALLVEEGVPAQVAGAMTRSWNASRTSRGTDLT